MKNAIKFITLLLIVSSCTKEPPVQTTHYSLGGGVFVVNEGNYLAGNGSISFYSYDSTKIYNDLFYKANGRPLGDVPNAMAVKGDKAYIIVNNSGKIEISDQGGHSVGALSIVFDAVAKGQVPSGFSKFSE